MKKMLIMLTMIICSLEVARGREYLASEVHSLGEYANSMMSLGCSLTQEDEKQELMVAMKVIEQTPERMNEFYLIYGIVQGSLHDDDKVKVLEWMRTEVEKHPENLAYITHPWLTLGLTPTQESVHEMFQWFKRMVGGHPEYLSYFMDFCCSADVVLADEEKREILLLIKEGVKSRSCDLSVAAQTIVACGVPLAGQDFDELCEIVFSSVKEYPTPDRVLSYVNFMRNTGRALTDGDINVLHEKMRDWMVNGKETFPDYDVKAEVTVTNIAVHYVLNSVQPEFAMPPSWDTGFVNVIAEVKGGCIEVPSSWTNNYPAFVSKFGSDFTEALSMKTGKRDGAGNDMLVWQDYVAGTDPTNEKDVFTASITIVGGKVTISYTPELDADRKAMRKYTIWGKKSLLDTVWAEVLAGRESDYNFFKVSVEMK